MDWIKTGLDRACSSYINELFLIKYVYVVDPYCPPSLLKIADPHGTETYKCCDAGPPRFRKWLYSTLSHGELHENSSQLSNSPTNHQHNIIIIILKFVH